MKKLMITFLLVMGTMTFVACGKKDSKGSQYNCNAYPGSILVTNQQQMNYLFNTLGGQGVYPPPGGGYNSGYGSGYNQNTNGYGSAYICVASQVYYQAFGGGGNYAGGNSYCASHPYDVQCMGNGGSTGGQCVYPHQVVCDQTGYCFCY